MSESITVDAITTAPVLQSEAEALAALGSVLPAVADGAAERDLTRAVPAGALRAIAESGLLGITVPPEFGGLGAGAVLLTRVLRAVATEDPSVAMTLQPHLAALDAVRLVGSRRQQEIFFGEALRGAWVGNATNERGAKQGKHHLTTRLTRNGAPAGHYRLDGRKYYSTGALTADWIAVMAKDDDDNIGVAWVRRDAPGVRVEQDWTAFGQRGTASGSTILDDVLVPEEHYVPRWRILTRPQAHGAYTQLHHVALDLGIIDAAIRDGAAYVRDRSRPAADSPYASNTDDPVVIREFGRYAVRGSAAAALLDAAGAAYDRLEPVARGDGEEAARASAEISVAVASAKAFTAEAAVEISSAFFEFAGAGATDGGLDLDRHWRNARTHTLHDPVRWKLHHVGNYLLNGVLPPRTGTL